jgi:hypothetical protein
MPQIGKYEKLNRSALQRNGFLLVYRMYFSRRKPPQLKSVYTCGKLEYLLSVYLAEQFEPVFCRDGVRLRLGLRVGRCRF